MGLDFKQLRELVIRPVLISITLWSESAENLILGTAMVESNLTYVHQIEGPAVSLWGIEPNTYIYLRKTLMDEYSKLHERFKAALFMDLLPLSADYLTSNMAAAIMFARFKYYLDPQELPQADDYQKLAEYHKRVYNSKAGATQLEKSIPIFKAVVHNVVYPY